MTYLVWELNPRLSVHEGDTLPTELTRFLYLPSRVRTDDLQSYSLMLFQLIFNNNRPNSKQTLILPVHIKSQLSYAAITEKFCIHKLYNI